MNFVKKNQCLKSKVCAKTNSSNNAPVKLFWHAMARDGTRLARDWHVGTRGTHGTQFSKFTKNYLKELSKDRKCQSVIDHLLKKAGMETEENKNYRPVNKMVCCMMIQ